MRLVQGRVADAGQPAIANAQVAQSARCASAVEEQPVLDDDVLHAIQLTHKGRWLDA
jgi:hypothetical protein